MRPFRYAGTLTAAQVVSSFVAVGAGLAEARETAQFQLEQEEKRRGGAGGAGGRAGGAGAGGDRATALRRQVAALHHRARELEQVVGVLFQGVFAHRFRDVDARVRGEVVAAVGAWAAAAPATFLCDAYLKYLAWAQSDRDPSVRQAAVAAIGRLYADADNLPRLGEFTGRFRARFVELMGDVDARVAAEGLRLLAALVRAGQLPLADVRGAYRLLADGDADVRRGAAALVALLLEEAGAEARAAAEERAAAAGEGGADGAGGRARSRPGKRGTAKSPSKRTGAGAAADGDDGEGGSSGGANTQLEGLLLVMGRLAAGEDDPEVLGGGGSAAAANANASAASPLPPAQVAALVGALAEELPLLGDAAALIAALSDEAAAARRGRLANAHLAALVAALAER